MGLKDAVVECVVMILVVEESLWYYSTLNSEGILVE